MRIAITVPTTAPIAAVAAISWYPTTAGSSTVVAIAITIPAMPKRLPLRAVSGEDSPRSARMKQTPAIR